MDKKQVQSRFFGAHIGCKVMASNAFGRGEYTLSGTSTTEGSDLMVFTEDGGSFSTDITDCKVILRHVSSITGNEIATMDAISMTSGREFAYHNKIEYLRSINVATPFMGHDPIAEGWAILEEKFPENAKNDPQKEEI